MPGYRERFRASLVESQALPAAASLAEAIELLVRLRAQPGHTFWTDPVSLAGSTHVPRSRLVSHAQVTDAHLLTLAREHGGRITTFDRGYIALAEPHDARDIELLQPHTLPTRSLKPTRSASI